jgi:hypothetical protein
MRFCSEYSSLPCLTTNNLLFRKQQQNSGLPAMVYPLVQDQITAKTTVTTAVVIVYDGRH